MGEKEPRATFLETENMVDDKGRSVWGAQVNQDREQNANPWEAQDLHSPSCYRETRPVL